jgi:hypothetical protein
VRFSYLITICYSETSSDDMSAAGSSAAGTSSGVSVVGSSAGAAVGTTSSSRNIVDISPFINYQL